MVLVMLFGWLIAGRHYVEAAKSTLHAKAETGSD